MNDAGGKLAGQYFLTFDDVQLQWQGEIVAPIEVGYYLCQLFCWLGQPTNCVVRHLSEMHDWRFYDDENAWRDAYRNASAAS